MALLALLALATLVANGSSRLRASALAFVVVSVAANAITLSSAPIGQVAVLACAGLVAGAILYVAAGDPVYGEDPEWRVWVATALAAIATPLALATLRTAGTEPVPMPLFAGDEQGAAAQTAAFWLMSSGIAVLVTARGAVRASLGALLMTTGVQLLVQLAPGPQLPLNLLVAWLEVVIALTGAFLVVNERALREA